MDKDSNNFFPRNKIIEDEMDRSKTIRNMIPFQNMFQILKLISSSLFMYSISSFSNYDLYGCIGSIFNWSYLTHKLFKFIS